MNDSNRPRLPGTKVLCSALREYAARWIRHGLTLFDMKGGGGGGGEADSACSQIVIFIDSVWAIGRPQNLATSPKV